MSSDTKNKTKFSGLQDELNDYMSGKTKWRTTVVDPVTKKQNIFFESYEEMKTRYAKKEEAAKQFKDTRLKLKMSQKELASVLRVNTRTLQGWESSRFPINPTAETLLHVIKKHPTIKKELSEVIS